MDLGPVAKNTWAASDPHNCVKFFTEFLGDQVVPAPTPGCPDGQCDCGIRGQTTLMNVSSAADGGGGFGLHTVNCQHHPTGSMSLEDFEHGIMHQVQNLRKPVNAAMLDLNMGLWARSLAPYIKKLNDAKTPFYATKWVDAESGETIYSITVRACGVVMLQLISNDVTSDVEGHVMLPTFKSVNPRMKFQQWNGPGGNVFPKKNMRENALPMGVSSPPAGSLLPIKISRPTTHARLDEIKDYYTSLFGASVLERTTFDDGSTVLTLLMPRQEDVSKGEIPSYGVHLQFWAHNDTFVSQTAGEKDGREGFLKKTRRRGREEKGDWRGKEEKRKERHLLYVLVFKITRNHNFWLSYLALTHFHISHLPFPSPPPPPPPHTHTPFPF